MYYGTEILMSNKGPKDDGLIRSDFPGGWVGDPVNAFTGSCLTTQQKQAQESIRKVLNWRKSSEAGHSGNLKHFAPNEGVYVYFRTDAKEKVMVILNKNKQEKTIATDRYSEVMGKCTSGNEVISGMNITDLKSMKVPAMSSLIIEMK